MARANEKVAAPDSPGVASRTDGKVQAITSKPELIEAVDILTTGSGRPDSLVGGAGHEAVPPVWEVPPSGPGPLR